MCRMTFVKKQMKNRKVLGIIFLVALLLSIFVLFLELYLELTSDLQLPVRLLGFMPVFVYVFGLVNAILWIIDFKREGFKWKALMLSLLAVVIFFNPFSVIVFLSFLVALVSGEALTV